MVGNAMLCWVWLKIKLQRNVLFKLRIPHLKKKKFKYFFFKYFFFLTIYNKPMFYDDLPLNVCKDRFTPSYIFMSNIFQVLICLFLFLSLQGDNIREGWMEKRGMDRGRGHHPEESEVRASHKPAGSASILHLFHDAFSFNLGLRELTTTLIS